MFGLIPAIRGAAGIVAIATLAVAAQPHEPVVLDVAVVDGSGHTVSGLAQESFTVNEDGHPVALETFREVAAGVNQVKRAMVIVLDDANVSPVYTVNTQTIARAFLARANPPDFVSVTAFSHRDEELVDDQRQNAARVNEFLGGTRMIFGFEALAYGMRRMAALARELARVSDDRKIIVCVGAPAVFDMNEPASGSALLPAWTDLMHTAVRTNTSVYLIDPAGLGRARHLRGTGLVVDSGGEAFLNSNDFAGAVDRIWSEAGHYYALSYAPTGPERVLHSIEVRVRGRGLHVHAPHVRGDYRPPAS